MFKKRNEGFTLIELMIVIAILGLLAAMVVPRLTSLSEKARLTEAVNMAGMIKSAEEMHFAENQTYTVDNSSSGDLNAYINMEDVNNSDWTLNIQDAPLDATNADGSLASTQDISQHYTIELSNGRLAVRMDNAGLGFQTFDFTAGTPAWEEIN